ncbi:hypothetical protein [Mammaliicoccus stepanovicii]|nr:hypothetical protein [Mammaliicoccus stepanovicii]
MKRFVLKGNKICESSKYAIASIFFIFASSGVVQIISYYLLESGLFWIIIFTAGIAGLILFIPHGLCLLPFFTHKKKWHIVKIYIWCIMIGLSMWWGIGLIMDRSTKIYTDEGGVGYYYGSLIEKQFSGYAYVAVAVLSMMLIVMKKVANKNDETETVDNIMRTHS